MKNRDLKEQLINEYGYYCMAGYNISRQNPLTMHHIKPKYLGGKTTFENASNVTLLPHSGIHVVSFDSSLKAQQIQDYFRYIKETNDITATKQFADWLRYEIYKLEYTECETKGHTLVYKRRKL